MILNTLRQADPFRAIRAMIWLYFWLLLLEGVFRKWVFPGFSDVFFLIRDPVVLAVYLLAWLAGVFPRNLAMVWITIIAILSLGFAVLNDTPPVVILFGLRTNYLHLPLIFVMGQVMNRNEVIRMGRWFMITAIPIGLLMLAQFDAKPSDWINVGAGGRIGGQIHGTLDKIRPPGPFSFISGPVMFFSLVAAFVGHGWVQPYRYPRLLLYSATIVTIAAIPISISRSLLLGILIVAAFCGVAALHDLRRLPRFLGPAVAAVAFLAFAADTIYVQAFVSRWHDAVGSEAMGFREDILVRLAGPFLQPFNMAADAPFFGHGIGLGTVAGARLTTGKFTFLLAESELARIVLELGPLLGFAFIIWRAWLALSLVLRSWRLVFAKGDVLAWLIVGASFLNVLNGQWGPATQLGFAVFGAGLALAAMNEPPDDQFAAEPGSEDGESTEEAST